MNNDDIVFMFSDTTNSSVVSVHELNSKILYAANVKIDMFFKFFILNSFNINTLGFE